MILFTLKLYLCFLDKSKGSGRDNKKSVDLSLRLRLSRYRQTPLQSYTSKSPRRLA